VITIDERIKVAASADTVWSIMSDPDQLVGCLPGAALGDAHEDGSFDGSLEVPFGPLKIRFKARIRLDLDEVARTGTLTATGIEPYGGTRILTTASFALAEDEPGSTLVILNGHIEIKGGMAGMIEGGASAVTWRLTDQFAECLAQKGREAEGNPATEGR
jgi:carbon monoxide dehydrogenase subunit G